MTIVALRETPTLFKSKVNEDSGQDHGQNRNRTIPTQCTRVLPPFFRALSMKAQASANFGCDINNSVKAWFRSSYDMLTLRLSCPSSFTFCMSRLQTQRLALLVPLISWIGAQNLHLNGAKLPIAY
jgi:hypothetical protein